MLAVAGICNQSYKPAWACGDITQQRAVLPYRKRNDGAGQGHEVVFGLTLSTGCGGITLQQRAFTGAWGNAAECGHITLPGYSLLRDGPAVKCYCGKTNCTESFISGTGLAERYYLLCGRAEAHRNSSGKGQAHACEQVARFRHQLTRLLATVVNIIDPHII